jgi:hypothetical protein
MVKIAMIHLMVRRLASDTKVQEFGYAKPQKIAA